MPALLESIRGRDSCYKTALRCIETLVDSDRGARMVAMEMQGDLAVLSVLAPLLHGDAPDPSACRIFQILLMRYEDCRADIPPEIIAAVDAFCRETDLAAEIANRPISAGAGVTAALPTALERVPSSTASDDVRSQSPDPSPSPDSTTALPESRSFASSAGGPADFTGECCIVTVFLPGGARSQVAAIAHSDPIERSAPPSTGWDKHAGWDTRLACQAARHRDLPRNAKVGLCRPQIEIGRDTTIGMLKKRAMLDSSGADSLDASEYALTPNASPHSGGRTERLRGCVVVPATF